MSSTPSDIPPPPPSGSSASPTQITGQQTAPSTAVPHTPHLQGTMPATNTLAMVSIVAAIGSFFAHIIPGLGGFTVAIIAVITGIMARNQIKQTGESGMGLATAGIIIGAVHAGLIVLGVVAIILIFVLGIGILGIAAGHSSG